MRYLGPQFSNRKIISECPRCEHRKIEHRLSLDELDVLHLTDNHTVHKCPTCHTIWTCVDSHEKVPGTHEMCLACMARRAGLKPLVARHHTI